MPVILIELLLVFGGVLGFAWWQLRDLERERRKRESASAATPRREPGEPPDPGGPR